MTSARRPRSGSHPYPARHSAPIEIAGPEGSWNGWWNAIDDEDDNISWYHVLTGSDAYEGLTLVLYSRGVWPQFPDAEYGVIYRGEPPAGPAQILAVE